MSVEMPGIGYEGYQPPGLQGFYDSPEYTLNYQNTLNDARRAMDRMAAANGSVLSGAHAKALGDFAGKMANQTYGDYRNVLLNLSGRGPGIAQSIGRMGMGAASNAGNAYMAGGNARASGYEGMGNALGGFIGDLGSYYGHQAAIGNQIDDLISMNPGSPYGGIFSF